MGSGREGTARAEALGCGVWSSCWLCQRMLIDRVRRIKLVQTAVWGLGWGLCEEEEEWGGQRQRGLGSGAGSGRERERSDRVGAVVGMQGRSEGERS